MNFTGKQIDSKTVVFTPGGFYVCQNAAEAGRYLSRLLQDEERIAATYEYIPLNHHA